MKIIKFSILILFVQFIITNIVFAQYSADLTGSGTAISSDEWTPTFDDEFAFDDDTGTSWSTFDTCPQWVGIDFGGSSKIIERYTMRTGNRGDSQNYLPQTWVFEGSNDGSSYTSLHSLSGQTLVKNTEYGPYDFSNSTSYRYYRIRVTSAQPYNYPEIGEIEMMEYTAVPEINVERPASTTIADGGTDAQGTKKSSTQVTNTYTVRNTGTAQLNVTNITSASASNVAVDNISTTNFDVAASGTATFNVSYTPTVGDGAFSFELDITNNDGDEANYDITVSGTRDGTAPSVTSIVRADANPTNASSVDFTVTFNEAVSDIETGDFVLATIGTANGSINSLSSSSGSSVTVTVNGVTGDGTLGLNFDFDALDSVIDGVGFTASADYTGEVYTVDKTKPDVTINQKAGQSDPTNTSPVVFTVVFNEPINDPTFTNADVNVGGTATTGTVTVTEVAPNDDTTFEVSVVVTADGTVEPTIPAGGVEDPAGNTNTVSTSTDNSVTLDSTKPDVTINQKGSQADPTNTSPLVFTVVFDEPINESTFINSDVSVGGTATTGTVTVTEVSPNDDTTFEVSIVVTANGTVEPTIPAGGVEDPVGNTNTVSTSTDNSVTFDTTKPDVTINQAGSQADPTNTSPVVFTAVFDEAINTVTFTNNDVNITGTATTGTVTVSEIAPNDATTFSVSVVVTADGTVIADIPAGGVEDTAGNTNTVSTSTDNSVTVDTVKPDVTINQKAGQSDPTNTSPVVFTIVFDEPINDPTFTNADVSVGGTATTGTVTVTEVAPNDDTTFEVSIVVTADGTVEPTIPAGGVEDPAGNTNTVSTSTDNTVTVDTAGPTPEITQAAGQTDPVTGGPVNFSVDFGSDVTGFEDGDINTSASTAPGTLAATVTGGPQTYNVAISGMTGDGVVSITFNAAVAKDLADNDNNAPTLTDNEVTYNDITVATVTTSAISSITTTSASSGGNVTSDGGVPVTARGVCWSTSLNPTIADNTTSDGTGTGSFTSSISGLSAGTKYYVRSYAVNSAGTAYGSERNFTTSTTVATVTTTAISSITTTTASSGGNVTSDGGASVTARGVCWNTSVNPTTANNITSDGTGTGSYTSSITGLSAGTTYYVRAYATNGTGTAYGSERSFTTTAPEINLKQLTTNIADGGSYDYGSKVIGTNTDVLFTIENTGTSNLTLTTPLTLGGADAGQYNIQAQPTSPVAASGSTTFTVRFTPTSTGAKTATIAIANNDSDENPYDLTLSGTGKEYPYIIISGYVKYKNGNPLEGVEVAFSNSGLTATTDVNGYYEQYITKGWSGTASPSMPDFHFSPSNYTYLGVTANLANQNYIATRNKRKISGYIKDSVNNGVEGAEVAFSSGGATVITNAAGYYNTTVAYGWNGTSVVTKQGWTCGPECSPVCFTYPIVTSNIIEPDHILTLIILGIEDQFSLPKEFTVLPAFPNPFNPSTTITYGLNTDSKVSIQIFNITGRLITTLINAEQASGWHSIVWNATNQQGERIPAGLYLSKITSGNEVKTSKLMLLK